MNYRIATLLDRETADTAATKVIDISLVEPISCFTIQFRGTNNGSTPTATPAKMISLVELVDGSDVLASLSGIQLEALQVFEEGSLVQFGRTFVDNNISIVALKLNFGRWLWDDILALDPTKFRNLQLRITHNKALGGSAPDAGQLSVFAHVFDERVISPVGFLMNKQVMSYALADSAHYYVDLPVAYPVRKLIIQSLFAGKQPYEQYNKIKLYTDEQKKVIINGVNVSDLLRFLDTDQNPYFIETIRAPLTTSDVYYYFTSTFDTKITGANIDAAAAYIEPTASYGGKSYVKASAANCFDLHVNGKCPHGSFCIPLGRQDVIEDWFDTRKIGSWKLDITAGSSVGSGSTCEIITQQLRSY
jgi:hypothetical protein